MEWQGVLGTRTWWAAHGPAAAALLGWDHQVTSCMAARAQLLCPHPPACILYADPTQWGSEEQAHLIANGHLAARVQLGKRKMGWSPLPSCSQGSTFQLCLFPIKDPHCDSAPSCCIVQAWGDGAESPAAYNQWVLRLDVCDCPGLRCSTFQLKQQTVTNVGWNKHFLRDADLECPKCSSGDASSAAN